MSHVEFLSGVLLIAAKQKNSSAVFTAFISSSLKFGPVHWANNIPSIFLSSLRSIQHELLWCSQVVSIHNINLYPPRYPFKPLGILGE